MTGIDQLYNQIPSFKCEPGCTDCCGPIMFAESELKRIDKKRTAEIGCLQCPYVENGSCSIYDNRPFICRLFGTVSDGLMKCPKGASPMFPLSKLKGEELTNQYIQIMKSEARVSMVSDV